MNEQSEASLRVVGGDSASAAPDGVPGPLRLLALLEELCGPREFWTGTKVDLADRLRANEKTCRQWFAVVEAAGAVAWVKAGGGKPGTVYMLRRGAEGIEAVRAAAMRGIWASASPGQQDASPGQSPGRSPGQHNADSGASPGLSDLRPVSRPVGEPYTGSSSSSSPSSGHPVDGPPTGNNPDPERLPLAARLYAIGVQPTEELIRELLLAGPDIADLAIRVTWEKGGRTPLYVQKTVRSLRNVFEVSRRVPAAESIYGPRPVQSEDEPADELDEPVAPAFVAYAHPVQAEPEHEHVVERSEAELEASYLARFRRLGMEA
ncbi:MAG: hypothetical protein AB7I38_11105 [Dehalococcoidia bacterium]